MSSSSIARQNRRMRLKQLAAVPINSSTPEALSTSELNNHVSFSPQSPCEKNEINLYKIELEKFESEKSNETFFTFDSQETLASATGCSFINCDVNSRPLGKVFIEEERGFKAIDKSENSGSPNIQISKQNKFMEELAIDLAFKTAIYFHSFSNFCHGLLGGMSLLYILVLTHFISGTISEETVKHFGFLSQPVHNIFNFLCIICCVSVFDKFDIANPKQLIKHIQTFSIKLIMLLIYPVCLILSLSTANVDDKLCLPERNSTILDSFHFQDDDHEFFYWKALSLSKCAGAVLGWIILSIDPKNNLLNQVLEHIVQRKKNSLH